VAAIPEIHRLTSSYLEIEDRIQLIGETRDGKVIGLWLTQRVLIRALPYLFRWLEQQTPLVSTATPENSNQANTLVQSFAQQEARHRLKSRAPQPPVVLRDNTRFLLVRSLDLSSRQGKLTIIFKLTDQSQTGLRFSSSQLRQWLTILHRGWKHAGWPNSSWPDWIKDVEPPPDPGTDAFH
jgi:hypothetical protein